MVNKGPPLPISFPCWVRAIFSWSGESKQDLGFVEGDLIECLNAGDGQWWFGRLKRNHTMGLFPSNFVEMVETRQPSRQPSPAPHFPSSAPNLHCQYIPPTPSTPQVPNPPPHRVSYTTPNSHGGHLQDNRTPTPLRSAMEDVMSSLDNMSVADGATSDSDEYVSAASFNASNRKNQPRSESVHVKYPGYDHLPQVYPEDQRPPANLTYSQRLEERIKRIERSQSNPPEDLTNDRNGTSMVNNRPPHIARSFTGKSSSTAADSNASSTFSQQSRSTAASSMSAFSFTSAGSLARRKMSHGKLRMPTSSVSDSVLGTRDENWQGMKRQKSGFFRKLLGSTKNEEIVCRPEINKNDWTIVRRDVNRVNSLSDIEKQQRLQRVTALGFKAIPVTEILTNVVQGDEHADGRPIDQPVEMNKSTFVQVDKAVHFLTNIPSHISAGAFAAGYLCRPYRSHLQKLRAIFTFMTEKIAWEPAGVMPADYGDQNLSVSRVLQARRGCAEEVARCVKAMCDDVGIVCQVVHGYLKAPGDVLDLELVPKANHYWNAMLLESEWRFMDASLASPSNPRRALYTNISGADNFYFMTRPCQAVYTHVPYDSAEQHLVPPVSTEVLLALPYACPAFFVNNLTLHNFNTSLTRMEGLETAQLEIEVPMDVECVAEVEVGLCALDSDGDVFETGNVVRKTVLAQAFWEQGRRLYRIKGVLPEHERQGILKVFAGKKGFMHSIKDNPHPLVLATPLLHSGTNAAFSFVTRHPCPHAQRHDIYVCQPQCAGLAANNTYIFSFQQHASTPSTLSAKPAKLAIQAPLGKITRVQQNTENGRYEIVTKVSETGAWRGLVLADRSARWCVFAEWICQ